MFLLIYKVELAVNKILIILSLVLLVSCGQSQEEKLQVEMEQQRIEMEQQRLEKEASEKLAKEKAVRIAAVTCSIMSETRNMDGAVRVREMNEAREKLGGEPFLDGDSVILEAVKEGYCEGLVLNEPNAHPDMRPTVKEEFYSNGKLKSRANYQPKSDGGKKHGLEELYHENGQMEAKGNYKDGERDGLREWYHENGQLRIKGNFKDGKTDGFFERYYENGQMEAKGNLKDGELDGLREWYKENGQLQSKDCYKKGKETDMSYCEK